jgi:D,D-heptose 1,7-bisphosphate phosphatase
MQLVIIAGGQGTRLKEHLGDLPKPMVDIGGRPLLEYQILLAKKHGIQDILLLTGYGADYIEQYFGDGSPWNVRIRYHREAHPVGTAGAVLDAFEKLDDMFLVMYGDTMLNVNLERMIAAHPEKASATLFLHPNDHPQDSDLVEIDYESHQIRAFHPYPHPKGKFFANLVNAALYVIRKDTLEPLLSKRDGLTRPLDFGKHVFPALVAEGALLQGYISREYIKDAGTHRRLKRVVHDLGSGRIQSGSLEKPMPAIFLDRDGTLNEERGFLTSASDLELLPGAAEAVRAINESNRLAVVITNQPVIARGECTEAELRLIHNKLEWLLGESHAFLDAIYYCPHHPEKGFPGERPELKFACTCRKPGIALFEEAAADLNIDLKRSWMIGDRAADIQAAATLGIRSALVRTGRGEHAHKVCKPDFAFNNVLDATMFILTESVVPA